MSEEHAKVAKELPMHKVRIENQLNILKAFAVLHEKGKSGASYKEVAPIAGISRNQVSSCLAFWKSVGLLEGKGGTYGASSVALDFSKKMEWGQEDSAWLIMRRHLAGTWFGEQIALAFKVKQSLTENEIINGIGLAYGVPKKDKDVLLSIKALLELLELSKFVIKKDNQEYALNLEMSTVSKKEPADIPEDKGAVPFRIGKETYIIDAKELREFVTTHGKKLAGSEIRLE